MGNRKRNTEAHRDMEYEQINIQLETFPNLKELCIYIHTQCRCTDEIYFPI